MSRTLAERAVRVLRRAGHEAYFVGGCVRDLLLGIEPEDWDVATSARPEEVSGLFARVVPVGAAFGVVLVVEGGEQVEVATFRSEEGYSDGRRPDRVVFSSAREDVLRRDFTINGLLYDPETGEVTDHVGGTADLRAGIVRAIGDAAVRFREDRLRILRAARIAGRFGFEIEEKTRAAIREAAPNLPVVSGERLRDELTRILVPSTRGRTLALLDELGLLGVALPEVAALRGVEQSPDYHPEGDVLTHTFRVMGALRPAAGAAEVSFPLALGALLHDVGKPATFQKTDRIRFHGHEVIGAALAEGICRRLRLSGPELDRTVWLVRKHLAFLPAREMRPSTLKGLLAHPGAAELLALARADALGASGDVALVDWVEARRAEWGVAEISPPPLLRGEDVLALGVRPGPRVGRILAAVREAQLDGTIGEREEALSLARGLAAEGD